MLLAIYYDTLYFILYKLNLTNVYHMSPVTGACVTRHSVKALLIHDEAMI